MTDQRTLYPLEFFVKATPRSLAASSVSRRRWKQAIAEAAEARILATDELGFLDERAVAVTIFYFTAATEAGDIDNIIKPIPDSLIGKAYLNDRQVERVVAQRFEPTASWQLAAPSLQPAVALAVRPPVVYILIEDDLSWRSRK